MNTGKATGYFLSFELMIRTIALVILLAPCIGFAQLGNPRIGARSSAMGHASVTNIDVWSVHHNQAALAFLEESGVGVSYENRFLTQALAMKGLVGAFRTKYGSFGVNVSQFGYSQYNENKFGLGYALKLAKNLSAGVQLNYHHIAFGASEYGNVGLLTAEVGFMAKITEKVTLGAHIFNLNYAKVSDYAEERLPMIFRLGAGYQFSEKFVANAEVEKSVEQDANVKIGAEYKVLEKIALRGGLNTYPFSNSFGFGFSHQGFEIDIATSYHSVLGYSPQASFQYRF